LRKLVPVVSIIVLISCVGTGPPAYIEYTPGKVGENYVTIQPGLLTKVTDTGYEALSIQEGVDYTFSALVYCFVSA
jgi:hypothetical protein